MKPPTRLPNVDSQISIETDTCSSWYASSLDCIASSMEEYILKTYLLTENQIPEELIPSKKSYTKIPYIESDVVDCYVHRFSTGHLSVHCALIF